MSKTPMELLNDAHEQVRKTIKAIEAKLNKLPCEKCCVVMKRDNTDPHYSTMTSLEWRKGNRSGKFQFLIDYHGGGQGTNAPLTQASAEELFNVVEPRGEKPSFLEELVTQIKDQTALEEQLKRFANAKVSCNQLLEAL